MINIQEKKEKILKFLEENGPSLPVRISKIIEMDPVFVSAIVSELISSNQVKTSNMKVGSSPLYLIPGQEKQLTNFSEHLKKLEREAFDKLREEGKLMDEKQEPAIRVALRSIKDFAIPTRENEKIVWEYAFKEENMESDNKEGEEEEERGGEEEEENEEEEEIFEEIKEIAEEQKENLIFKEQEEEEEEIPKAWETRKAAREIEKSGTGQKELNNIFANKEDEEDPEFLIETKKFLKKREIEFLNEIRTEKKEIVAEVKINSQLGKIKMLLIAKNKKSLTKEEIRSSIQMSTNAEMPCLLIIRKEPPKSIESIIENNNLIKLLIME